MMTVIKNPKQLPSEPLYALWAQNKEQAEKIAAQYFVSWYFQQSTKREGGHLFVLHSEWKEKHP